MQSSHQNQDFESGKLPSEHFELVESTDITSEMIEFAKSRIIRDDMANNQITREDSECFKVIPEEYLRVKLSKGYLEYIDNDPEGLLNDGIPMVFIHGYFGNAFEFKPYLDYFSGKIRCISLSIFGLEKHFPHPEDINEVTPKNFVEMIVEFTTEVLGFNRIILAGHSLGGGFSSIVSNLHPELVAGVCVLGTCKFSLSIGIMAFIRGGIGAMYQYCDEDWSNLPDINDPEVQKEFAKFAIEDSKDFHMSQATSKSGKEIKFSYTPLKNPYESMAGFCYGRDMIRTLFESEPSEVLTMFAWGEKDFITDPETMYRDMHNFCVGKRKLKSNSEFLQPLSNVDYFVATTAFKTRIFGSQVNYNSRLAQVLSDSEYLVSAQAHHCYGFSTERHNMHTKRWKYLTVALEEYYKDICMVEQLKGPYKAKL
ncbi:unnamed protein product [Moneuplotes crassus]|uniref:AB hydrolase-1 domain-containing protein n=1 Tax=Euplotes crassus TaxID=5936 RepID=A0AAD1X9F4_EUPCR|nr:unnamed protein product [Moneuplotes crassus]